MDDRGRETNERQALRGGATEVALEGTLIDDDFVPFGVCNGHGREGTVQAMTHFVMWRGLDGWRAEVASVELCADGLTAIGTQLGSDPLPYRLDYRLDASARHVTRSIEIVAVGQGWRREL